MGLVRARAIRRWAGTFLMKLVGGTVQRKPFGESRRVIVNGIVRDLAAMEKRTYDVLVIGGGINGTAIARDAALRGMETALIEKDDFGYGTSSRSTRLIHGGLRYLELFDFYQVREGLRERELLLRQAPHLVTPLPFIAPIYRGGRHSRWTVKIGMILYDLLSWDKSLPNHRSLSKKELLELEPGLNPSDLLAGTIYYDAQCELPERLCVEHAMAAAMKGADVANHVEAVAVDLKGDVKRVQVIDRLNDQSYQLQARVVVNAAGPWADLFNRKAVSEGLPSRLRTTKGIHLVVPKLTDHAIVLLAKSDGRVFFVIPWRGYSLVGTTDTDFSGDLDRVDASQEDIDYMVNETLRTFPEADMEQAFMVTSGVRALVRRRGSKDESAVSRRHEIADHARDGYVGLFSVLGGKITNHRAVAEEAVDRVVAFLGRQAPGMTKSTPHIGGEFHSFESLIAQVRKDAAPFDLDEDQVVQLARIYGSRYRYVLEYCLHDPSLAQRIHPTAPEIWAQLAYGIDWEMVRSTADFLMRRVAAGLSPGLGEAQAPAVAAFLAKRLNWTPAQHEEDLARYRAFVALMHPFGPLSSE